MTKATFSSTLDGVMGLVPDFDWQALFTDAWFEYVEPGLLVVQHSEMVVPPDTLQLCVDLGQPMTFIETLYPEDVEEEPVYGYIEFQGSYYRVKPCPPDSSDA